MVSSNVRIVQKDLGLLARRCQHRRKISRQRSSRGYVNNRSIAEHAFSSALIAIKKEQFVLNDGAADNASKLVALEIVSCGGVCRRRAVVLGESEQVSIHYG